MPDSPSPTASDNAKHSSRVRYNAMLKWVRRVHMYAGLFLAPWVFLYGVTGFLFNHPEAFPDREVRTAGRSEVEGTALDGFPTAPELAERVVDALNAGSEGSKFRLVDRGGSSYSRTLFVTATGRGLEHSIRIDPDSSEVFIRSTTSKKEASTTWVGPKKLAVTDPPADRLAKGVPAVLAKLGLEVESTAVKNPTDLICTVESEGQLWRIAYNIQTGASSAKPAEDPSSGLSTRRFLTGMHLSFTYPSKFDIRWVWGVAVDAMSVAMVFWGVSGVLMWWQMKKLRGWGLVCLVLSIAVAVAMAAGMHGVLAAKV